MKNDIVFFTVLWVGAVLIGFTLSAGIVMGHFIWSMIFGI